ncbi:oxidoreductase [Corallococcus sp. M34]|uniref:styrene monooxygenase/indole monooxygenase family protein n=1 Tax=Citreicoccus inhibens TaxID=2849499 RepID=UPI001C233FF5|nr:styrene monooxygenase/indole monooxygenase family protein [Citreicoccus inhibens]MBU8898507.1 oxidoreductase [Citreicoccus inhibens]
MRDIGIVGAGQAGLLLAFALRSEGYPVTLYSDRTPEQIFNARIQATTYLFGRACQYERELGLNFWEGQGDHSQGGDLDICGAPGTRALRVYGRVRVPGMAVDLRVKYPRWLGELERRGGTVVYHSMDSQGLEALASRHELVVVTTGRNSFPGLFERDAERSPHTRPARNLAAMVIRGMRTWNDTPFPALKFVLAPGHGEYFSMPYHDRIRGPETCILVEAIPGQGLDRFGDARDAAEMFARMRGVVHDFSPWLESRLEGASIVDESSWLVGGFTPMVRKPVGRLASGKVVLGLGDAVILNDPIAGQGLNCASKAAHALFEAIREWGDRPFTEGWMQETSERFWQREGKYITAFTNLLLSPASPHMQGFLGAASEVRSLGDLFFDNFGEPQRFWPWIDSAEQTQALIAEAARAEVKQGAGGA